MIADAVTIIGTQDIVFGEIDDKGLTGFVAYELVHIARF